MRPSSRSTCVYRAAGGKDLQVSVRYALPIDINPWNDFYIGCTVTATRRSSRPARTPGTTTIASTESSARRPGASPRSSTTSGVLRKDDVPRFEAMTKAMLKAAQPFAHDCKLAGNGGPVDLKSIWIFSFDVQTTTRGCHEQRPDQRLLRHHREPSGSAVGTISNLVRQGLPRSA